MKIDSAKHEVECPYCGRKFIIDDEVQHVRYDNAEQAGYEFEKGRQRAQREAEEERQRQTASQQQTAYQQQTASNTPKAPQKKSHGCCITIFLWLMFFPIMLTIWVWRTDKIHDKRIKGIITAVIWILIVVLYMSGN